MKTSLERRLQNLEARRRKRQKEKVLVLWLEGEDPEADAKKTAETYAEAAALEKAGYRVTVVEVVYTDAKDGQNEKKKPPNVLEIRGSSVVRFSALSGFLDCNHVLKQNFKRHCVTASFMSKEKLAVAIENAVFVNHAMVVVRAVEGQVEAVEVKAGAVFGVTLRFFQFSNQS